MEYMTCVELKESTKTKNENDRRLTELIKCLQAIMIVEGHTDDDFSDDDNGEKKKIRVSKNEMESE